VKAALNTALTVADGSVLGFQFVVVAQPVEVPPFQTDVGVSASADCGAISAAATKARTNKTPRNRLLVELAELVERLIAISLLKNVVSSP
jgi:hypothetical protein